MRKLSVMVLMFASMVVNIHGQAWAVQKVAILALSKDTDSAKQVELGLRDQFATMDIRAISVRAQYPSVSTAAVTAAQLRSQGYDRFLCVAPRQAIRLDTGTPTMDGCLTIYIKGDYAAGDAFTIDPTVQNLDVGTISNTGQSRFQVLHGMIQMFDTATEQLVWQGPVNLKISENLRTSRKAAEIVKVVWKQLIQANLVPVPAPTAGK